MKSWVIIILFAPFLLTIPTQALRSPPVTAWTVFKHMGGAEIQAVDGKYTLDEGEVFQAEVWFKATTSWISASSAFGYGTASADNGDDIDGNFSLVQPPDLNLSAFDSISSQSDRAFSSVNGGSRPFGDYSEISYEKALQGGVDYLGIVYTLWNGMAAGNSGTICLYSDPYNTAKHYGTSIDTGTVVYVATQNYQFNTIPEPSSLMAVGCAGVGVLGNLLHRRRRRTSAKVS